ncbi:hypothetical protein Brsp06_04804 [Brucella sp. NBRC 13694]
MFEIQRLTLALFDAVRGPSTPTYLGRRVTRTRNCAGTTSNRSETSSPMQCRHPPQAQIRLSGSTTSSIRGRCFGREPRLIARGLAILFPVGASPSSSAWMEAMAVSRSSRARSNWSGSVFSDLRPKAACLKAATSFSSRSIRSSYERCARPCSLSRSPWTPRAPGPQSASPSGQQRHREDRRQPTYPETTKSRPDLPSESVVLSHRAAAIRWSPAFSSGRHEPAANRGQRTAPRTGRGSESSGHPVCRAK